MTPPYVRNIVFACPGASWDEYQREGRRLAAFYAELLGMDIVREDWFVISGGDDAYPRLAFGDGPGSYEPPRWPDPDHPQQMHVDVATPDLASADALVTRLGATTLDGAGSRRIYADPAGHPFCIYADEAASQNRVGRIVFDCFSPRVLAGFYSELLGMPKRVEDAPTFVAITREDEDSVPMLAFEHSPAAPPRWPDPNYPQQVHLDIDVENADTAHDRVLRLGAIPLPAMGGSCPVYADPAGHPFCLCQAGT